MTRTTVQVPPGSGTMPEFAAGDSWVVGVVSAAAGLLSSVRGASRPGACPAQEPVPRSGRPSGTRSGSVARSPLTEQLGALRALALRHGIDLRVHLQGAPVDLPDGPPADLLAPGALAAWSDALTQCVTDLARCGDVTAAELVLSCTDTMVVTVVVHEYNGLRPLDPVDPDPVDPDVVGRRRVGVSDPVRERLREVGGRARSRPGQGTVLELQLSRGDLAPRPAVPSRAASGAALPGPRAEPAQRGRSSTEWRGMM